MSKAHTFKDAALMSEQALPAAASTSVYSDPIRTQNNDTGHFLADTELEIVAPALTTTILPDTRTATYSVVHGDALDGNGKIDSPVVLFPSVIVQTGAGGAGAAAKTFKTKLPTDIKGYVAVQCAFGASTTTGAALKFGMNLVF